MNVHYIVYVTTSDIRNAGTDANVYIQIYGKRGETNKIALKSSLNNPNPFEAGQTDKFKVKADDVGTIKHIRIGHDNTKFGAGWHLDKVKIKVEESGRQYLFHCNRWLDKKEDDGAIERILNPVGSSEDLTENDRKSRTPSTERREEKHQYFIEVATSDIPNASTGANVYIQLFGSKGFQTDKIFLSKSQSNKRPFMAGQSDIFPVELDYIGNIKRIRIGHDGTRSNDGWHLKYVKIDLPEVGRKWYFDCNKWLDLKKEDRLTERELELNDVEEYSLERKSSSRNEKQRSRETIYKIHVQTSNITMAGTDAQVYIQLFGENELTTGKMLLKNSQTNKNSFEQGRMDIFEVKTLNVGEISKIIIGHDNSKQFAGWHLEKVIIQDMSSTRVWEFPCNKWFDKSQGDKKIERELYPVNSTKIPPQKEIGDNNISKPKPSFRETIYKIHVQTSNIAMAGTDAQVYIQLFGENNLTTGKILLKNSQTNKNPFEQGHMDVFEVKALNIGEINRIIIGHDNSKPFAGWHLDKVFIEDTMNRKAFEFPCNKWFDKSQGDKKIERELYPVEITNNTPTQNNLNKILYVIYVTTSNIQYAGTDAKVFIQLFSKKYKTEKIRLKHSLSHQNPFEKGQTDRFEIETIDVGEIEKIRIGHDNSKPAAGWHLDKVKVEAPSLRKSWTFPCGLWLDSKEGDGQIERDLVPSDEIATYEIFVKTSDKRDAGTDANVYIQLFGTERDSNIIQLKKSKKYMNKFEQGKTDQFEFKLPYLGDIRKLKVGHDDSGAAPAWHLANIIVECKEERKQWNFIYNNWLSSDGGHTREVILKPGDFNAKQKEYVVDVYTGDHKNAGTDANVFLTIYGENEDSGERKLKSSKLNKNKFEKNQLDRFIIEAPDLGVLKKIKIRHDNSGSMSGWFLDKIEISDGKHTYKFLCNNWLATDQDDGKIERVLYEINYKQPNKMKNDKTKDIKIKRISKVPKKKIYYVSIHTGDKADASSFIDSNVYIQLFGDDNISIEKKLAKSLSHEKKFEKNKIDVFQLEFDDLGTLFGLKIRHDNFGENNNWYLERIEIIEDNFKYKFVCKDWLSKNKKDGKIERTLVEINALAQFEEINF